MPNRIKTLAATVALSTAALLSPKPAEAQADPFIGQIMMAGYNFCPRGWANADGQLLPISSNAALFSLYGTTFGGDGRTTFALPDLRGRVPMHTGQGPGLASRQSGQKGGTETNTLSAAQMPAHSHSINVSRSNGSTTTPQGTYLAGTGRDRDYTGQSPDATMSGNAIGSTGGGQPIDNMQPYLVIRYCVALQGIFPSRN
ncbi:MAG: tail fiber protein [Roseovarius sp.]|uniref:phage tail protein n=1 Tax=Roseovarius sp. TaxID=1486281 RepID=UPI0032F04F4B